MAGIFFVHINGEILESNPLLEGEFGRAGHGLENRWYFRGMGIDTSALRHLFFCGLVAQLVSAPPCHGGC